MDFKEENEPISYHFGYKRFWLDYWLNLNTDLSCSKFDQHMTGYFLSSSPGSEDLRVRGGVGWAFTREVKSIFFLLTSTSEWHDWIICQSILPLQRCAHHCGFVGLVSPCTFFVSCLDVFFYGVDTRMIWLGIWALYWWTGRWLQWLD